jgi:tripartite ATP-independent transporter DctM subunit
MFPPLVGVIGFVALLLLMAAGMPIGFAFITIGFFGITYLSSLNSAMAAIARIPYTWASEYIFSCIPLFVLMGFVFANTRVAEDLYGAVYKWLGRLPGGLALATIVGCGGFAAVSGSSTAGAATMGAICYPEMRRYNYSPGLSSGVIASAGTLGIMIPPSIGFIIFGILTEQSIGRLFIAGIIPGLLEIGFYFLTVIVLVKLRPHLAPYAPTNIKWIDKLKSVKAIWPILLLFVVVLGGIYLGLFTPTEAGGVGAVGSILITLSMGRLKLDTFLKSLVQTIRITMMIFLLIMGAMVFNVFLTLSHLPLALSDLLSRIGNPILQLALILFSFFPLGCFMDASAMMVLTIPLYLPTIIANDFSLIWFGVLVVRSVEMGLITPPIGMNVYVVKGVVPDIPIEKIFVGIIPFFIADILCLLLLAFFPELSLFLPSLMM